MAAEQFDAAEKLRAVQQAPRRRLNRAIQVVDSMITLLERLNLKGTAPAREILDSGISAVLRAVPAELGTGIGRTRSPEKLMEELFALQQSLMAMRAGPGWEWAYADDERDANERRIAQAG